MEMSSVRDQWSVGSRVDQTNVTFVYMGQMGKDPRLWIARIPDNFEQEPQKKQLIPIRNAESIQYSKTVQVKVNNQEDKGILLGDQEAVIFNLTQDSPKGIILSSGELSGPNSVILLTASIVDASWGEASTNDLMLLCMERLTRTEYFVIINVNEHNATVKSTFIVGKDSSTCIKGFLPIELIADHFGPSGTATLLIAAIAFHHDGSISGIWPTNREIMSSPKVEKIVQGAWLEQVAVNQTEKYWFKNWLEKFIERRPSDTISCRLERLHDQRVTNFCSDMTILQTAAMSIIVKLECTDKVEVWGIQAFEMTKNGLKLELTWLQSIELKVKGNNIWIQPTETSFIILIENATIDCEKSAKHSTQLPGIYATRTHLWEGPQWVKPPLGPSNSPGYYASQVIAIDLDWLRIVNRDDERANKRSLQESSTWTRQRIWKFKPGMHHLFVPSRGPRACDSAPRMEFAASPADSQRFSLDYRPGNDLDDTFLNALDKSTEALIDLSQIKVENDLKALKKVCEKNTGRLIHQLSQSDQMVLMERAHAVSETLVLILDHINSVDVRSRYEIIENVKTAIITLQREGEDIFFNYKHFLKKCANTTFEQKKLEKKLTPAMEQLETMCLTLGADTIEGVVWTDIGQRFCQIIDLALTQACGSFLTQNEETTLLCKEIIETQRRMAGAMALAEKCGRMVEWLEVACGRRCG